jgi:tripartite-type tricarboxylate transporter receptor subunit TctC
MALRSRYAIASVLSAAFLTAGLLSASAQEAYPSREIRVICAFPAGSGADVFARFFAEGMKPAFDKNIIVENRVGASGNLATNFVARAKPDGYTLYIHAPSALAANMHLFKDPGVDAGKSFDILGTVAKLPFTVSVAADKPWKDLRELIAHVKAKGDKASYATTAPTGQVAGAMMTTSLGLKNVEVPYRTAADSLNDLLSGNIDYAMYDPIFALAQARAGKLRILAMSSGERMKSQPDIPTMIEGGVPGVNVVGWWGLIAPKGVPDPIKQKLSDAFRTMAEKPETREFLAKFGGDPFVITPAEAQKLFLEDIENWGRYVKIANMEPRG